MIQGIFKYFDKFPLLNIRQWDLKKENSDHYKYEMAAYKLDRMLGIGLVPVTVERTIDKRPGVVQLWLDGLISKLSELDNNIKHNVYCDDAAQTNMIMTFDYLIRNTDRNLSNILYSEEDWQIWFIDHSRAFGTSTKRVNKKNQKLKKINITKVFKAALTKLTLDDLKTLRPWLHKHQINGIWKRRNKLLGGNVD